MNKKTLQSGQVLLLTIMLIATAVTIVLTIAFKSTTDTKITKLEEQNQKSLSAAESAIEYALEQHIPINGSIDISSISGLPAGQFTGSVTASAQSTNLFVTPLISKDQQYTFYLFDYANNNNYYNGSINLYMSSEGGNNCGDLGARNKPAVELTFIDNNNQVSKRMVLESCTFGNTVQNPSSTGQNGSWTLQNNTFTWQTNGADISVAGNIKFMIIRVLYASTKIALQSPTGTFNTQGKVITAEVSASNPTLYPNQSGSTKKIQLFQSYPQIPADFFVTSFGNASVPIPN